MAKARWEFTPRVQTRGRTVCCYDNAPMESFFHTLLKGVGHIRRRVLMLEGSVVLISCGKTKHQSPTRAADLYRGSLFIKSLAYAKSLKPKSIYILSAKYGLLDLDDHVEPYELTLNNMKNLARSEWAQEVLASLREKTDLMSDHFVFLAGLNYRRHLEQNMARSSAPLEGLSFGKQLAWLSR